MEQFWSLNLTSISEKARCSDGKTVEAKHSFNQATFKQENLKAMETILRNLHESYQNDYSYNYFMTQYAEKQVQIIMKSVVNMPPDLPNPSPTSVPVLNEVSSIHSSQEQQGVQSETLPHSSEYPVLEKSENTNASAPLPSMASLSSNNSSLTNYTSNVKKVDHLRTLISCLFAYLRSEDLKSEHFTLSKDWLTHLIEILLRESIDPADRLFLLHHILRCSGGISTWAIGFVQCISPLDGPPSSVDEAVRRLNHCLLMLSTILSPVEDREKFLGIPSDETQKSIRKSKSMKGSANTPVNSTDDSWLLVDPDTEESEEVFANRANLTETDIIDLLKQVPFVGLIKFITEGASYFPPGSNCIFGQFTEIAMLKLLAVSTRIIKILRQGLITFNCMQFKTLTEYITLLIKITVKSVSKFWTNCKSYMHSDDQALFLRLQVEFDHFILRTATCILESQRYGIWRFISVIPYSGVTEAMMWHILWVFYNNGRDETDDLGGLCPYVSDSYWKAKFDEPAVKFLFREKLPSLSECECYSLLESLANMVKSRSSNESEFITTVTNEMLELSFMLPQSQITAQNSSSSKDNSTGCKGMAKKCTELYAQLARIHPFFISALIHKIRSSSPRNELIIEAVSEIPCESWTPKKEDLNVLIEWLVNTSINHFSNRLARVFLTKINWGCQREDKKLHMDLSYHRMMAIELFNASKMHVYADDGDDPFSVSSFRAFDGVFALTLAKSSNPKDFILWCWRLLLALKLHLFEQPYVPNEKLAAISSSNALTNPSANDAIVNAIRSVAGFDPIPSLDSVALHPVAKGLAHGNPFSSFIVLTMTEQGHRVDCLDDNLDLLIHLLTGKNYIQSLSILSWFVPLHIDSTERMIKNSKFIAAINSLLVWEQDDLLERILGLIKNQLESHADLKVKILSFWIHLLFEVSTAVIKMWSSSWFLASKSGLQQVCFLFDSLIELTASDDLLHSTFMEFFKSKTFDELYAKQMSSSGLFSWITVPFTSNPLKKCEWITPFHVLQSKYPEKIWLSWLVIKTDMEKMKEIWHQIVAEMDTHYELPPDVIIKSVCTSRNLPVIPQALLPVYAWGRLIIETPVEHSNFPVICFNFFKCYFSSTGESGSMGHKFVSKIMLTAIQSKMNSIADYHHREWSLLHSSTPESALINHHAENKKLYTAFSKWLDQENLHDAFVDFQHLNVKLQQSNANCYTEILKLAMEGESEKVIASFVDHGPIFALEEHLMKLWLDIKVFDSDVHPLVLDFSEIHADITDSPKACPPSVATVDTFVPLYSPQENKSMQNSSSFISMLQQNIHSVMEEGKFFQGRMEKLTKLSSQLLALVPGLYQNLQKNITVKKTCDKDSYDAEGCSGAASITFNFLEAKEDARVAREIEKHRMDIIKVVSEMNDTPSDRIVSSIIHIEMYAENLSHSPSEEEHIILKSLLDFLLARFRDRNCIYYPPTKHLFTVLMDSFVTADSNVAMFLLETAISHPHLVEYLAPRLIPSKYSTGTFLSMYQLLQEQCHLMPPQVAFVLLSKFDVSSWLKRVPDDRINRFHEILADAIYSMGVSPYEDKLMILGLYRKHLQYSVIYQFPSYLTQIMALLLKGMSNFKLFPAFWNDMLLSFGLYLRPGICDREAMNELKKYANSQPLFSSSELYSLLQMVAQHFSEIRRRDPAVELLEYFKDYINEYSMLLTAISFMWINVNSRVLNGNLDNIWNPLLEAWRVWIYPNDLNKLTDESPHLTRVWFLCNETIQYFSNCFNGLSSAILSLTWQSLASYLRESNCIDCQNLGVIQSTLKSLPWSRFVPSESDIELMFESAYSQKGCPSKLISYIIQQVNWTHASQYILNQNLAASMERLAYVLIAVISLEEEYDIRDIPLHVTPPGSCLSLCQSISRHFVLHQYIKPNPPASLRTLMAMLKTICAAGQIRTDRTSDLFAKQKYYADSLTNILEVAVHADGNFFSTHIEQIKVFFNCDLLNALTMTFSPSTVIDPESRERIEVFNVLFNCVASIAEFDSKRVLTNCIINEVKNSNSLSILRDCFVAACESLHRRMELLVYVSEKLISFASSNFASNDASTVLVTSSSAGSISCNPVQRIPPDLVESFLNACVQQTASLTLALVVKCSSLNIPKCSLEEEELLIKMICQVAETITQMKPISAKTEGKIMCLWYSCLICLFDLMNQVTQRNPNCKPTESARQMMLIRSCLKMSKQISLMADEFVSPGFMSFIKFGKKSLTARSAFLALVISSFCVTKVYQILEDVQSRGDTHSESGVSGENSSNLSSTSSPSPSPSSSPDSSHQLMSEVSSMFNSLVNKINSTRKAKTTSSSSNDSGSLGLGPIDIGPLVDKTIDAIKSNDPIESEGIPLLKSWLISFYADTTLNFVFEIN